MFKYLGGTKLINKTTIRNRTPMRQKANLHDTVYDK